MMQDEGRGWMSYQGWEVVDIDRLREYISIATAQQSVEEVQEEEEEEEKKLVIQSHIKMIGE